MSGFIRWADVPEKEIHRGHYRRQVEYPTCYVALHRYTGDGEGYGLHSHPETQAGYVLTGEMAMLFEGAPSAVFQDDSYVIPTALHHGGKAASAESVVINLYVKRHLVGPATDPVLRASWGAARKPALASGVRQSLFDLKPGEAPPKPDASVEDSFDVVLSGDFADLRNWDAVRHEDDASLRAGSRGARIFRMEILPKE